MTNEKCPQAAMVCDVLKCIEAGGKFIEELYSTLLEGNVAAKLDRLTSISDFVISVSKESHDFNLLNMMDSLLNVYG